MDVICFMKLHLSKMCLKPDTEMGVLSGRSSQPDFVQDVLKKKEVCVWGKVIGIIHSITQNISLAYER